MTEDLAELKKLEHQTAPFALPELPYAYDALAPHISKDTLEFHHRKHHAAYVEKLNKLVAESEYAKKNLKDIIIETAESAKDKKIFNNAAQVWNHEFFWFSMRADGGGKPTGKIADMINDAFGSYDDFCTKFVDKGVEQFGSGWVWLIADKDKGLAIKTTGNADLLMASGEKALLTADLWEHAYYLDYQNRRKDFLVTFLKHLANWDFAEKNLSRRS
ncbi:MAG: superoxide dismutase [Alphaproteobacteria bacterium]|nr:superoxide dismutase [Alphaproteobacteria bacterium]